MNFLIVPAAAMVRMTTAAPTGTKVLAALNALAAKMENAAIAVQRSLVAPLMLMDLAELHVRTALLMLLPLILTVPRRGRGEWSCCSCGRWEAITTLPWGGEWRFAEISVAAVGERRGDLRGTW